MPPMTLTNGLGGFTNDGRATRCARRRGGNAAALGERDREPALRNDRHGIRLGVYLVGQQPREPPDRLRERPGRPTPRLRPCSFETTNRATSGRPRQGPWLARGADRYLVQHSAGLTQFSGTTSGIDHELDVFVDVDDPVKFSLLALTNSGSAPRTLERVRATTNGCSGHHATVSTSTS